MDLKGQLPILRLVVGERLISVLAISVIILHALSNFFPSMQTAFPDTLSTLNSYNQTLSSYVAPLLIGFMTISAMVLTPMSSIGAIKNNRRVLYPALMVSVGMLLSTLSHGNWDEKTIFTSANFLLVNIWLFVVISQKNWRVSEYVIRCILFSWVVLPLAVMVLPKFQDYVNFFPCTLHGFSDSRLIYGFWAGALFIVLAAKPLFLGRRVGLASYIAISLAWLCMLLSQTRTSVLALMVVICIVLISTWPKWPSLSKSVKWGAILLIASALGMPAWNQTCANASTKNMESELSQKVSSLNGSTINMESELSQKISELISVRPGLFVAKDPMRVAILDKYTEHIERNWLWGYGRMYTVDIPEKGVAKTQAHNVLIQIWANYGVLTLLAFAAWITVLYFTLQDVRSKMLLLYLVVYSLFQPLLGGSSNIFSPQPMLVFMIIFMLNAQVNSINPKNGEKIVI